MSRTSRGTNRYRRTNLKRSLLLNHFDHGVRQGLVKLEEVLRQPLYGRERMSHRTCCRTFIANCGVIAPLVISSSSESVRAIPILQPGMLVLRMQLRT